VTTEKSLTRQTEIMTGDACAKYYSPTEHLANNEIIVLFKGRVVFKQYIPKKHIRFGITIYKLCDSKGYTYNMSVYRCPKKM
jgi:hypothetical protein